MKALAFLLQACACLSQIPDSAELEEDYELSRVAFNVFLEEQSVTKLKSKMDCECGAVKCNCLKVCDCKLPMEVPTGATNALIQTGSGAGLSAENMGVGTRPVAPDTPSAPTENVHGERKHHHSAPASRHKHRSANHRSSQDLSDSRSESDLRSESSAPVGVDAFLESEEQENSSPEHQLAHHKQLRYPSRHRHKHRSRSQREDAPETPAPLERLHPDSFYATGLEEEIFGAFLQDGKPLAPGLNQPMECDCEKVKCNCLKKCECEKASDAAASAALLGGTGSFANAIQISAGVVPHEGRVELAENSSQPLWNNQPVSTPLPAVKPVVEKPHAHVSSSSPGALKDMLRNMVTSVENKVEPEIPKLVPTTPPVAAPPPPPLPSSSKADAKADDSDSDSNSDSEDSKTSKPSK